MKLLESSKFALFASDIEFVTCELRGTLGFFYGIVRGNYDGCDHFLHY